MLAIMLLRLVGSVLFFSSLLPAAVAQSATALEVASVRPSRHSVGPDYNNQLAWSGNAFTARNATLRRLIADGWRIQLNQVIGPSWLDANEYDIEARFAQGSTRAQRALMLRDLLAERFHLKQHSETRNMRVYELTVAKSGVKIEPVDDSVPQADHGFHFHGEMRQFADLLAVQFSIPAPQDPSQPVRAGGPPIPVIDKTGLDRVYDFTVDVRPEIGTDLFTAWQRVLESRLGLRIESTKGPVEVEVVDDALKDPTAN